MKLFEYLYETGGRGRLALLSKALNTQPQLIGQWAKGRRNTPRDRLAAIEQATCGRVTVEEMRPDLEFRRIKDKSWPHHPAGRPHLVLR